jgi:shikimate kinase
MGSGKTTIGRRLANRLKFDFLDLDSQIEKQEKRTVDQIFSQSSETYFREIEHTCLKEISSLEKNIVISTGGGAPCFYNNMDIINQSGKSVYLQMHPHSLAKRIEYSKRERPLLKGMTEEEIEHFIETKLIEREKYYLKANFIIKGESLDLDELVGLLGN